jgi:hypothetical protein
MADELADAGWLEKRYHGQNAAYFWTQRAETALDLSAVATPHEGSQN